MTKMGKFLLHVFTAATSLTKKTKNTKATIGAYFG